MEKISKALKPNCSSDLVEKQLFYFAAGFRTCYSFITYLDTFSPKMESLWI